jgi:hypothetical protein
MRLLVLGKICISQMFGLCDLPSANFGLFISLLQLFWPKIGKNCTNEQRTFIGTLKGWILISFCQEVAFLAVFN